MSKQLRFKGDIEVKKKKKSKRTQLQEQDSDNSQNYESPLPGLDTSLLILRYSSVINTL